MNSPFIFSTRISTFSTSVRVRFLTTKLSIVDLLSEGLDIEQAEMPIMDKQMASVGKKKADVIMCFIVWVFSVRVTGTKGSEERSS